jgi:hypothetical protein
VLTELGKLTRLSWRGGAQRWALSRAPSLVYDARCRLAIVYGAERVGEASSGETRAYRQTHWGLSGEGDRWTGVVAHAPFRVLGEGVSITYTTRKATSELADYVHEWGEGAGGEWRPPIVLEHVCRSSRCEARGALSLRGGTYRVKSAGIVG